MDGIDGAEGTPGRCNSRSGSPHGMAISTRPRWFRFRITLRMSMVLVALVGGLIAFTYRRVVITRGNVASLAPIATLAKSDVWRIAWSPERDRMGIVGFGAPVEVRDAVSLALVETIGEGKKIIHFA